MNTLHILYLKIE